MLSGAPGADADGGAAGTGLAGGSSGGCGAKSDSVDDGNDLGTGGYQSRPRGAKAARRNQAEDIRASRMLKARTDALSALA